MVTAGCRWCDRLIPCTSCQLHVPQKLNVSEYMLYNIFDLHLDTESHCTELLHEYFLLCLHLIPPCLYHHRSLLFTFLMLQLK